MIEKDSFELLKQVIINSTEEESDIYTQLSVLFISFIVLFTFIIIFYLIEV